MTLNIQPSTRKKEKNGKIQWEKKLIRNLTPPLLGIKLSYFWYQIGSFHPLALF
jgi:hypothetical protein